MFGVVDAERGRDELCSFTLGFELRLNWFGRNASQTTDGSMSHVVDTYDVLADGWG